MMIETRKPTRMRRQQMPFLLTFMVSMAFSLTGGRPARGSPVICDTGENVYLTDPVVTIIEGSGDESTEQAHWSALGRSLLNAPLHIGLGERTFNLERVP